MYLNFFNGGNGYGWVFFTDSLLVQEFIWIVGHRNPQRNVDRKSAVYLGRSDG